MATVFTGVAAIAGGLGPTALAATTKPAVPLATHTTAECGANTGGVSKWLHLFYPNNDHPAECTHGSGFEAAKGTITAYCPGNTWGTLFGRFAGSPPSVTIPITFTTGNNERFNFGGQNFVLSGISVNDTTGNQKCES